MALAFDDIAALFDAKGARAYDGEDVSQLEHALQTAALAEADGASAALVTAALLHDLGHMLNDQGETPTMRGVDDVHQYAALPFLRGLFGDDVLVPIQMHVDAKRYLCAARPDYHDALSEDSKRSLKLQGGVYSNEDADRFIRTPFAADAVRLRIFDDRAKRPGAATPPLSHFLQIARQVASIPAAR
jgi:phosphonate degradation associated HDIG domain protein